MTNNLSYAVGSEVQLHGQACVITAQIDVDQVLVQNKNDGETKAVNIVNLKATKDKTRSKPKALDAISDEDLDTARMKFAAIEPFLDTVKKRSKLLKDQAKKFNVTVRTLQRWLQLF